MVAGILSLIFVAVVVLFAFALRKVAGDADRYGETRKSCEGCHHYLGGGACRVNMERECADDDYQLWEAESHEVE